MSRLSRAASLLFVLAATAPPASAAQDCQTLASDDRIAQLEQAPTCRQAMARFEACAYGASGDIALGAVVIGKCEAGFLGKLTPARRKSYDRAQSQCARKYAKQSGTLYRSFEAFCRAKLAKTYSDRFAR
jgi:hypothetical protein